MLNYIITYSIVLEKKDVDISPRHFKRPQEWQLHTPYVDKFNSL